MPIHGTKIKNLSLTATSPTELTAKGLKKQLNNIGLLCDDVNVPDLETYIEEVKEGLPVGKQQTFGIMKPVSPTTEATPEQMLGTSTLQVSAQGNWRPNPSALGYTSDLEFIQYPTHFDLLYTDRAELGFTGQVHTEPDYDKDYATINAIKKLFVDVGTVASSAVVDGLDKTSIEAALSNVIAPLNDANAKNYDQTDSRVFFIVENYNPNTDEADGIGVLTVDWHLTIKDYKHKKELPTHATTLSISTRSAVYTGDNAIANLKRDILYVKSHLKTEVFTVKPKKGKVKVFDKRPPATEQTALDSLPNLATANYLDYVVLYSPDLDQMGSLDNSESEAQITYSKQVTRGFTFTASQSFSASLSVEVNIEIIKVGVTLGFTLSFSESWSKSMTETIQFSVPKGEKSFAYQGTLKAATLRYDPSDGSYKYTDDARLLTNIFVTRKTPLVDGT